ncbi:MAG: rhomboid family intramembrane serine protease [Chloroflexi bacterium]|nr:rhomboid family intramembrane serine protease [Chloroflexota bacterium]
MLPLSDPSLRTGKRPYVNVAIIVVNAVVFLYEITLGDMATFFYTYGLIPQELTSGHTFTTLLTQGGRLDITTPFPTWATLFTSMFIHGSWMHFIGNMVYLWVFGDNIEGRIGHIPYLLFYVVAGVVAAFTQVAIAPASQVPTVGASGAIAGVLGAYLVLYPRSRVNTLFFAIFITVIQIPAALLLGVWILMQFVSGLGSLGVSSQSGGVAYWAHIGGFALGAAVFWVYRMLPRKRPPPYPFPGEWE